MTGSLVVTTTRAVAAGRDWDAVRGPLALVGRAPAVLQAGGHRTGPVLRDAWGRVGYLFVPAGALAGRVLPGAVVLSVGWFVVVPPYPGEGRSRTLPRWVEEPGAERPGRGRHADPTALATILTRLAGLPMPATGPGAGIGAGVGEGAR